MARLAEARFARPSGAILNMLLFLMAIAAGVYYLSPYSPQPSDLLIEAFNANQALNGLILSVLAIGIIYNLRAAGVVSPAARWVERWSRNPKFADRAPRLLRGMENMLADGSIRESGFLSGESSRAILESIGTRIDEGRDMGRYIMNLLVFLGLLGTFWGLLETVNAVADTINGLAATSGPAEDAVQQLIVNLQKPLSGMGTAFSSSLFGLGGSLIIGFLDLQASQAQNRFYTDVEEWLASRTRTTRTNGEGKSFASDSDELVSAIEVLEAALEANTRKQIEAQASQSAEMKDEIRALNRTLIRVGGGE